MTTPRSSFGIAVLDNHRFVVRGFNGFRSAPQRGVLHYYYDATTDAWAAACNMDISLVSLKRFIFKFKIYFFIIAVQPASLMLESKEINCQC